MGGVEDSGLTSVKYGSKNTLAYLGEEFRAKTKSLITSVTRLEAALVWRFEKWPNKSIDSWQEDVDVLKVSTF